MKTQYHNEKKKDDIYSSLSLVGKIFQKAINMFVIICLLALVVLFFHKEPIILAIFNAVIIILAIDLLVFLILNTEMKDQIKKRKDKKR